MLSREQAQVLTRLVHLLRPAWNEEGIWAAIAQVHERNASDVCLAAIRAATDDKAKTPGVIPTPGPHWNEKPPTEVVKPSWMPPRRDEDCPLHAGQYRDSCHGCAADRLAGDQTTAADKRRPDVTGRLAAVRGALKEAKA